MNVSNRDGTALRTVGFLVLSVCALAALWPRPSMAAGVVGTGSPASCTEAALDVALVGGGSVTFNCGPAPATITVTSTKTIGADTVIQGGLIVTISGGGKVRIFIVAVNVTLTLDHITISRGAGMHSGGAIVNRGTLQVINSIFSGNKVTVLYTADSFGGGAIFNDMGTMTIENSIFSRNRSIGTGQWLSSGGGAISNNGMAKSTQTVTHSTFFRNQSNAGGGAIANFNPLVTDASDVLTVINSSFLNNHSGARDSVGSGLGGAIYNSGGLTVTGSTFLKNSGDNGGAIESLVLGLPTINTTLTVTNSTFVRNAASGQGGAIHAWSDTNTSAIVNSTFSRNRAGSVGLGGGVANINGGAPLTMTNTILSLNHPGGNCPGNIIDGGHNLRWPSSDHTCVGMFATPRLAKLADYGGPTLTMALCRGRGVPKGCKSASPAIDAGDDTVTLPPDNLTTDQRGFLRQAGLHVDIGAFEVQ